MGFFHGWILEFSKHFSEVHVICLQKGEYIFPPHVYVYSLGKEEGESRLKYVYRFYAYFGHIFFHVKVEYVFFHMGAIYNIVAAPFFCIRKLFATKFYWWKTHGHIGLQSRIAVFFVDRVYTAAEVSFPVETKKKYVIGHAINTDVPLSSYKEAQIKKTILFVGRVSPVKNIEYVLQTAEILRKKGIDFCVRIVGPSPDAQYKTSLEKMIVDLDLFCNVSYSGPSPIMTREISGIEGTSDATTSMSSEKPFQGTRRPALTITVPEYSSCCLIVTFEPSIVSGNNALYMTRIFEGTIPHVTTILLRYSLGSITNDALLTICL